MRKKTPIEKRTASAAVDIVKTSIDKALEYAVPFYAPVRDTLLTAWTNSRRTFFDEFLLGLDTALSKADDKKREKIYKEFDNKQNDIWLGEITNSVLFSKARKSRVMLGLIAAKYLGGEPIDYFDTVIAIALKELLDEEISLLQQIYAEKDKEGVVDMDEIAVGEKALMFANIANLNLINRNHMFVNKGEGKGSYLCAIKSPVSERMMGYIKMVEVL